MDKSIKDVLTLIKEKDIKMVDFKMVDINGQYRHVTIPAENFSEDTMKSGIGFDASNYGYAVVEKSDMVFIPDPDTAVIDPFCEIPTLSMTGNAMIIDSPENRPLPQYPRNIIRAAVQYMKDSGVADEYALWITDGLVSVTNCTFTGARGIKVHGDSGSQATVTVDSCTFDSLSAKPGFAFGTIDTVATLVTIKNCEFIDCQPGDGAEDPTKGVACVYETDTAAGAWLVLNGNASFEPVLISTAEELMNFASAINGGESYAGKVVKLTGDIDLGGSEWTPIGQTGTSYGATNYFQGVFDGQGYTIKNFKITETNGGANYAAGLFGFIDAADATIKNLNVDNAEVNGHHWTGVIAGYITGSITNCTVTNSKVVCTHANNDACGDKAGIITGYVNAGTVTGNTVKDCTVKAGRDGGQVAGAAKTTQVYGNTVINVTVTATGDCTGANISNAEIGRIMG